MKNFKSNKILMHLNSYFECTTLHGFAYVSVAKSTTEKIFWILALICSFTCCFMLLYELVMKIENNPVIVDRPDVAVPIKNITYPAISVCPAFIQNGSTEIFSLLFDIRNISFMDFVRYKCKLLWTFDDCYRNDLAWKEYELAAQYWLNLKVEWLQKYEIQSNITISAFGWCKTFNIVGYDSMVNENSTAEYFQYQKPYDFGRDGNLQSLNKSMPFYTSNKHSGFRGYIQRRFKIFSCNFDAGCNKDSIQTTVIVHSPYEMPDFRHTRINIDPSDLLNLALQPQIKITHETLLDMDVNERRCYTVNERKLKYFKTYTSINCLRECESTFILEKCSCVPYFFINNDTNLICNTSQITCFDQKFKDFQESTCLCYPPCEELTYEVQNQRRNSKIAILNENPYTLMKIVAKFKDEGVYPQIRRKYFTMIDWFSFVGGILGLFFGFSLLSGFEIIFHVWKWIFMGKSEKYSKIRSHCAMTISNFWISRMLERCLNNFLKSSSIHGLCYISNKKLKISERLAWLLSFILSITSCTFMILQLHHKFAFDSVSIVAGNRVVNVSTFPFPAVTILDNTIYQTVFLKGLTAFDDLETAYVRLSLSSILNDIQRHTNMHRLKSVANYSHKIITMLKYSSLKDEINRFGLIWDDIFTVPTTHLMTSLGYGYSFNIAKDEDMFYKARISQDFYYEYESNAIKGGILNTSKIIPWTSSYKLDQLDMTFKQGPIPMVYIHSPFEYPIQFLKEDAAAFEISFRALGQVLINPEIVVMDEELNELPLTQRLCYLDHERKLKFFKFYTQRNCEVECLAEKLLDTCGCIPFDVVRENDTKICELSDYLCVDGIKALLFNGEYSTNICDCLQPCSFINYKFEFVEYSTKKELIEQLVSIRFKDNEFLALERIKKFTIFDFLSYIGGLLGLFAGISVLSIFEIIYFFFLRLICEIFRFNIGRKKVEQGNVVIVEAIMMD